MEGLQAQVLGSLTDWSLDFLFRIIGAVLILWIGFKLTNFIIKKLKKRSFKKLDESAVGFVTSFLSISLKVVVCVTAAAVLGVPLTAMVTILGSAGLAIGLALQGSLANLAGGIMILIFRPFVVGDFIDTHTDQGTVTGISIFYTTLLTADNRKIVVPNGSVSNAAIINYSAMDKRRVDMEFSVSYDSDTDKVIGIMTRVASSHSLVMGEPAPFVRMLRQDESALVFILRAWCSTGDYWTVYFDMQEQMKKAFDEAGIEIPYPHVEVVK